MTQELQARAEAIAAGMTGGKWTADGDAAWYTEGEGYGCEWFGRDDKERINIPHGHIEALEANLETATDSYTRARQEAIALKAEVAKLEVERDLAREDSDSEHASVVHWSGRAQKAEVEVARLTAEIVKWRSDRDALETLAAERWAENASLKSCMTLKKYESYMDENARLREALSFIADYDEGGGCALHARAALDAAGKGS